VEIHGVYGEAKAEQEHRTWTLSWLCAGDFNEILYQYEKEGVVKRAQACLDRFKNAIEDCGLYDLGFTSDVSTWRNNQFRSEKRTMRERLDRALANIFWGSLYPTCQIRNGDHYHSNHRPVIIVMGETVQEQRRGGERMFKFEASWLEEEKCRDIVPEAMGGDTIAERLKGVARSLSSWNHNVLGDLEKRPKKMKKELEQCRRSVITNETVRRESCTSF
jgi:hypothetical protein